MISAHESGHILEIQHNLSSDSVMNFNASLMLHQIINKEKDNQLCHAKNNEF